MENINEKKFAQKYQAVILGEDFGKFAQKYQAEIFGEDFGKCGERRGAQDARRERWRRFVSRGRERLRAFTSCWSRQRPVRPFERASRGRSLACGLEDRDFRRRGLVEPGVKTQGSSDYNYYSTGTIPLTEVKPLLPPRVPGS